MSYTSTSTDKSYVSVIVPCYNAEKTLPLTLKSLENQSYKNFEVIVVNDGSKDDTDRVVSDYVKSSKLKIQYIEQENAGVSVARNTGLFHANGKYILFLDADDVYHRDYIRVMFSVITKNNVDAAYCFFTRNIESIINADKVVEDVEWQSRSQEQVMHDFIYMKAKMGLYTFIYKHELINKYNIRFTPNTKYGEDLEFTWKYLSHCTNGVKIDKELYGYYNNPTSAVNTVNWSKTDLLLALQRTTDYLEKMNCETCSEFKEYFYSRSMWAVAKTFARGKRKDLYKQLHQEYNVKPCMKVLAKGAPNILVRISSLVYCINPSLYYFFISLI